MNAIGIAGTTASKSSFLAGAYCIIVPFVAWVLMKKKPNAFSIVAAMICLAGIACIALGGNAASGESFGFVWGDWVSLLSTVLLALQVVLTSKLAHGKDILALSAMQFLVGGSISIVIAVLSSPVPSMTAISSPDMMGSLAFLVFGAGVASMLLQNVGLAHVSPSSGSIICSFETVFGAAFAVAFLGDVLSPIMFVGFALMMASVFVSEWLPSHISERSNDDRQSKAKPGVTFSRAILPIFARKAIMLNNGKSTRKTSANIERL